MKPETAHHLQAQLAAALSESKGAAIGASSLLYLNAYLAPLLPALSRPDVTDIFVNQPGEYWVETLGGGIERHSAAELDDAGLWRLARQIASLTNQGISREHPLLSATLHDGSRVQVIAPPVSRGGMALAIRKHVVSDLRLADYASGGAFDATRIETGLSSGFGSGVSLDSAKMPTPDTLDDFLADAVRARKNVVISGGTSTGKTTFLNALAREIPESERLILIEDTPEVQIRQANSVRLIATKGELGEARVTADDLLQASLRMRPDRIILGELRGIEAYTFLRAVNTGHPGSLTTLHADSSEGAVEQLALIILQSGAQMRRDDIVQYVKGVVDIFVQLGRRDGHRKVEAVVCR
jgi:type IV secretion system protein VirB11